MEDVAVVVDVEVVVDAVDVVDDLKSKFNTRRVLRFDDALL